MYSERSHTKYNHVLGLAGLQETKNVKF